jgi:hypothetical protein
MSTEIEARDQKLGTTRKDRGRRDVSERRRSKIYLSPCSDDP